VLRAAGDTGDEVPSAQLAACPFTEADILKAWIARDREAVVDGHGYFPSDGVSLPLGEGGRPRPYRTRVVNSTLGATHLVLARLARAEQRGRAVRMRLFATSGCRHHDGAAAVGDYTSNRGHAADRRNDWRDDDLPLLSTTSRRSAWGLCWALLGEAATPLIRRVLVARRALLMHVGASPPSRTVSTTVGPKGNSNATRSGAAGP